MEIQLEQLEQEKKDLQNKMKQTAKRYDHVERAFRKEEIPLLTADYEQQKVRDEERHRELQVKARAHAQAKFELDKEIKSRVLRLMGDYEHMKQKLEQRGSAEFAKAQAALEADMKREKAARRQELQLKKAIARKKLEWEEEQERRREEEEIREREEAERRAEEKRQRAERERAEYEERRLWVFAREYGHPCCLLTRTLLRFAPTGNWTNKRPGRRKGNVWQRRKFVPNSPADPSRGLSKGQRQLPLGAGKMHLPGKGASPPPFRRNLPATLSLAGVDRRKPVLPSRRLLEATPRGDVALKFRAKLEQKAPAEPNLGGLEARHRLVPLPLVISLLGNGVPRTVRHSLVENLSHGDDPRGVRKVGRKRGLGLRKARHRRHLLRAASGFLPGFGLRVVRRRRGLLVCVQSFQQVLQLHLHGFEFGLARPGHFAR
jgi:hypothetical protein